MSRPVSIQSNTILDAARKVFMRDGFKAGTAVIAREAGVSEGSLFKHFKNKCNLFLMAMDINAGEPSWEDNLLAAAGRADLRTTLESAGLHLLQHLRLVLPRLMMVSSSGVTIPKHDQPGQRPPPLRKMDLLCRYFTAEVKAGRLVMDSPRIQAHAFLGALSHYAWCETLFGYRAAGPETYVKTLVDTLLKATHHRRSQHVRTRKIKA
ncbi:MAG: TetR/AcrR family transcriptional regulator [bacterium]